MQASARTVLCVTLIALINIVQEIQCFHTAPVIIRHHSTRDAISTRRYGFFKDMLDKAFQNDDSLSLNDKRKGQLDSSDDMDSDVAFVRRQPLTRTQEKWRQMNAPEANMEGKSFILDFYLAGVPNKDPSNDLFGSRVNISARDKSLGISIPEKPTVPGIRLNFLPDKKCFCETQSAFTEADEGDWILSDDKRQIRFRMKVIGYTRTVETKGSIQSVYWSNEPSKERQSSTVYSIPSGWLYGEASISANNKGNVQLQNGVLKIEQETGLLGASTKMVPCGKFTATEVITQS
jgi:hypothetical protein